MTTFRAPVRVGKSKRVRTLAFQEPDLKKGLHVVVRTDHGTEIATLITDPVAEGGGLRAPDPGADLMRLDAASFWERIEGRAAAAPAAALMDPHEDEAVELIEFVRRAEQTDIDRMNLILEHDESGEFAFFKAKIEELGLPMKPVQVEHVLGGEKILFYFTAEQRVDFRALVRLLSARFNTRAELRHIGPRETAAMSCGVGVCGKELCCSTWLKVLKPVTIKMARDQGRPVSGDSNLGACGRLRCCLRYELDGSGGCGGGGGCSNT